MEKEPSLVFLYLIICCAYSKKPQKVLGNFFSRQVLLKNLSTRIRKIVLSVSWVWSSSKGETQEQNFRILRSFFQWRNFKIPAHFQLKRSACDVEILRNNKRRRRSKSFKRTETIKTQKGERNCKSCKAGFGPKRGRQFSRVPKWVWESEKLLGLLRWDWA